MEGAGEGANGWIRWYRRGDAGGIVGLVDWRDEVMAAWQMEGDEKGKKCGNGRGRASAKLTIRIQRRIICCSKGCNMGRQWY